MAMVASAAAKQQKIRWGELDDEDGLDFLLPPREVTGPDENGLKRTVEYRFDDDGNTVKVITTTRVRGLARTRLSKSAVARRGWSKFGDAVHEDVGARLTMVSTEEIVLERPRAPGSKADEPSASGDPLSSKGGAGASLMVCRTCGKKGDHWTIKCPYKDLTSQSDSSLAPSSTPDVSSSQQQQGKYVPPKPKESEMRRRNDENSVRVTNLSEETREADLHELFGTFGPVSRAYVALDHRTGASRGFGFVSFVRREDAEKAISKLNGYGYDSLILHVEWAAPRPTN